MKKICGLLTVITAALLLVNCVNVEMETTVNEDRSGQGKLVYSYDPSQNVEQVDIDETFAKIEGNQTVQVTGRREYDSEGTHYREIAWTFKDINKVDIEGLTYSYTMEEGKPVLRAIFEEITDETANEPDVKPAPAGSPDNSGKADTAAGKTGTNAAIASSEGGAAPAGSLSGGQGLTPQEQMEIDAETQRQMEQMLGAMIDSALEGFSVKFRFVLPREVYEAQGATIDGDTATWEFPLKDLVNPSKVTPFNEFKMIMKPE